MRRRWVDEESYADLVALCQMLPGAGSSQLQVAIGALRAGPPGGLAAWLGFTLPSAAALVAFAYGVRGLDADAGWLHGLKVVAVAVVAHALVGMARTLTPDLPRIGIAVASAATALAWRGAIAQVVPIIASGVAGAILLRGHAARAIPAIPLRFPVGRRAGLASAAVFLALLVVLPVARQAGGQAVAMFDSFYRAGALVFGGGHVVLPLLHSEVVPPGWVGEEEFVAGYGAAQAIPGPLFAFAAYLGAAMEPEPSGVGGAAIALVAIFLPSFLLLAATLPFWSLVRTRPRFRAALLGVGAGVVGLLVAAFWDPIVTRGIDGPADVALAAVLYASLAVLRLPPWLVVALGAAAGAALAAL